MEGRLRPSDRPALIGQNHLDHRELFTLSTRGEGRVAASAAQQGEACVVMTLHDKANKPMFLIRGA